MDEGNRQSQKSQQDDSSNYNSEANKQESFKTDESANDAIKKLNDKKQKGSSGTEEKDFTDKTP